MATPSRDIKLNSLRDNIALVSQDVVLFNDTLGANIAYGGKHDATIDEIRAAAKAAHALEFIDALPEGLDTMIGENGVKLSGGQRQRLAIARAHAEKCPDPDSRRSHLGARHRIRTPRSGGAG